MLHANFQDHMTSGSGEEDFLRFLPRFIIYINFAELESPMLQAKFQDHRRRSS